MNDSDKKLVDAIRGLIPADLVQRLEGRLKEPILPKYVAPEKCGEKHPLTGRQCTGGKGHFGCHQVVWDPYQCEEWWVTPCNKASPIQECNFHENSGGNKRLSWNECIHCGQIKDLRVVGCAPAMELIMETDKLMTQIDWLDAVESGGFIDDDGYGVLATDVLKSDIVINPSDYSKEDYDWPEWATHVVWYNR